MNQIDEIKDIADGMIGIGGIPSNRDFYAEFNFRVQSRLGIRNQCEWEHVEEGMFGCNNYVWKTSCGKEYDSAEAPKYKFCPNCGCAIS